MMDRRIPYDPDAERAILASCLLDANVLDDLRVTPGHMYGAQEVVILRAMLACRSDGEGIDPVTVASRVDLLAVSPSNVSALLEHAVSTANVRFHEDIVMRHAMTRAILDGAARVEADYLRGMEGDELLTSALASLSAVDAGGRSEAVTIGEIVRERVAEIDEMWTRRDRGEEVSTGITTGIPALDDRIGGGWQPVFNLVAGRPKMGKSACLLAFADAASAAGHGVHVVSLEDTRRNYADRALARRGRIRLTDLRTARLDKESIRGMIRGATELGKREHWLYTDRQSLRGRRWTDVVNEVRANRKQNKTVVAFIDYANIIHATRHHNTVNETLGEIIHGLADAADSDGIAYVVGCQLNRKLEYRDDKRPILADLKDCGALEARGKLIIGLHRGAAYTEGPVEGMDYRKGDDPPDLEEWRATMQMCVIKQNQGPEGIVRCRWIGERAAAMPWDDEKPTQTKMYGES